MWEVRSVPPPLTCVTQRDRQSTTKTKTSERAVAGGLPAVRVVVAEAPVVADVDPLERHTVRVLL